MSAVALSAEKVEVLMSGDGHGLFPDMSDLVSVYSRVNTQCLTHYGSA